MPNAPKPLKNRRRDWRKDWREFGPDGTLLIIDELNATFPRDDRETINDRYEKYASTATVGDYLAAMHRVRHPEDEGPELPDDFGDYLNQRIPSMFSIDGFDDSTPIDRFGQVPRSEGLAAEPLSEPNDE